MKDNHHYNHNINRGYPHHRTISKPSRNYFCGYCKIFTDHPYSRCTNPRICCNYCFELGHSYGLCPNISHDIYEEFLDSSEEYEGEYEGELEYNEYMEFNCNCEFCKRNGEYIPNQQQKKISSYYRDFDAEQIHLIRNLIEQQK